MATPVYDVVVVGAGLMGSAAAYYATKAGKRVLVLEQFELLHGKGSSHGASRIFRVAYPSDVYTKLCLSSLKMWRDIEKEAGVELIRMTGEVDFASERIDDLRGVEQTLARFNVPFEVLTGTQVNERFPGFSLSANSHAVYNPLAGVLNPTLAMATMQKLAKELGTEFRERSPVNSVVAEHQTGEAPLAVVTLANGTQVRGRQCIVTAGPWTEKLLKMSGSNSVELQPIATFGAYWKCKNELYTPDKFPVFLKYGYPEVYGLPMMDPKEGVKICRHDGPDVNPDQREGVLQPADEEAHLQSFVAENFSHVDSSAPNQVDHCMYTMTPDANFVLDFMPIPSSTGSTTAMKNIVIGAGFSGHGAKMTPVIGQILADLAIKGKTNHSTELFRRTREVTKLEHYSFPMSSL
ncbi:Sarcosine oxidase [Phytophthora megakarya]|uniref:sarcosine oxidasee (formaldehyde-forming) n=1 Tax=Phytophthora megakarya TaxID=4795 RepID=A0A225VI11_9STRA|nr:Sarcosine oxidase [Phytophthora megakarya]